MFFKIQSRGKYYCHHIQENSGLDENSIETSSEKTHKINITKNILESNNELADKLRHKFAKKNVYVVNVMSSPGSGKTLLLEKTLSNFFGVLKCAVIVGDICTSNDADRLRQFGNKIIQINTDKFGGDCHLTASLILNVLKDIDLDSLDLLIIENIGNLVCPAEFDLGENSKIVIFSVTEGEDKPAKYPLMFREADLVLLNKIDLLPHLDFDVALSKDIIKSINFEAPIIETSGKTEEGLDSWIKWLKSHIV